MPCIVTGSDKMVLILFLIHGILSYFQFKSVSFMARVVCKMPTLVRSKTEALNLSARNSTVPVWPRSAARCIGVRSKVGTRSGIKSYFLSMHSRKACVKASARLPNSGLAFFIGDCCVCPGEVQRPDHVLVAVLRRDVQHRLPLRLIFTLE